MIDMGHSDKYDLNNQKSILEVMTMSETAKPEIKVFPIHQDEFSILGNENILTESSDFGYIWEKTSISKDFL